jgi:cell division protein FtsA
MKQRITAGIDIGSQAIRVVISEWHEGEIFPTVIGVGIAHTSGLRHGYIIHLEEAKRSIQKAVRDAERNAKIKIESAVLAIGGISLESTSTEASLALSRAENEVTTADLHKVESLAEKELTKMANRKIIHAIPVRYKLDDTEILGRATGLHGNRLEVKTLFVTCLEQHLNDLITAVEELGIEVNDVVAAPVAASLVLLNKKQKTAGCVLVNIGAETMSLVVYENDIPIALQVFPIGGTDITNDIALALKVPLDEAENIKIGKSGTGISKKKLEEIIQARMKDIFELVGGELKKIGRAGLLPAGVIISGGSAYVNNVDTLAKNILKIPARVAHVDMQTISKGRLRDSSWSVAYGLTLLEDAGNSSKKEGFKNSLKNIERTIKNILGQIIP